MRFIDSHCHLAGPEFDADREDAIGRAREVGAEAIVCVGESLTAADRAAALAAAHPGFIYHTAGIHPYDAAGYRGEHDIAAIDAHLSRGAVAVGECGLDYSYEHVPRERQLAAFADQLALAGRRDRPVIVHTREAEADTQSMVQDAGRAGVRGVLHCFTGSHELAEAALAVGWYVSFSGIVTFKKWADDALLRLVPDDRLLAESDAPFLAPVPRRGKRNEPAWVAHTVARLAAARGQGVDEVGALVARNARALFRLGELSAAGRAV
jgi:TatD DNase family protein